MTVPAKSETTIRLIYLISLMKKMELSQNKKKILELEQCKNHGRVSMVYQHKYNLISSRAQKLRNTIENLRHLELQLKK